MCVGVKGSFEVRVTSLAKGEGMGGGGGGSGRGGKKEVIVRLW